LAAIALVASLASLYVHYQLLRDPSYTSFCDVSATVSCAAVYASAYGTVAGVPVAAGGAIWAALVLLLAASGMGSTDRERAATVAGYVFLLSVVGLAAVFYYAYASFVVLKQMCPLCMTVYATVIGIFIVSSSAASTSLTALPSRLGRDLRAVFMTPTAATLAILWIVGSASLVAFFPRGDIAAEQAAEAVPVPPTETLDAQQLEQWHKWLDAQVPVADVKPQGNVKVLVVKFNDFQCPACRQAWAEYRGVVAKYEAANPGVVEFQNRDFPLESECGVGNAHPAACEAAVAVRLARAKNRGNEMEEWFFTHQPEMTPDRVKQAVREVAQVTDFDAQYPKVLAEVRADSQMGQRLGVNGTPTFFINGIKVPSLRASYFDAAIAYELQKAQGERKSE
jgi:uncharacterized membrane protein/protein-disulfide isomerase